MQDLIPLPITGRDRYHVVIGGVSVHIRKANNHVLVDVVKNGDPLEDAIASVMCTADGHPPILRIEEATRIARHEVA